MKHLPLVLVTAGLLGLLASPWLAVPAWAWLALVGGGLAHSLAWRAAGVRRANARERRKHEVRLRNAERRERRLVRTALRTERRVKEVLARCVDMEWADATTRAVRALQEQQHRHEQALARHKMLAEKTSADLSGLVESRLADEE